MTIFATLTARSRRGTGRRGLSEAAREGLPAGFDVVAEHVAAGLDASVACAVVGRDLARHGAGLGEALDGLRRTYDLVLARPPEFEATEALGIAWSEATLEYLSNLSCEDPLTGLASVAHVRSRLSELYRGAAQCGEPAAASHALVVVDLPTLARRREDHRFTRAFRLVKLGEAVRGVFPGSETIGRLTPSRVVVVVRRDALLGRDIARLRQDVEGMGLSEGGGRVWVEGLPPTSVSAARLLDELARG